MEKHTVFITGAAGYVGAMLVRRFAARDDVAVVIGLDKEPCPELIATEPKLVYLRLNTADAWEEKVRDHAPDIIVHAAWQIRELYGRHEVGWRWNIEGSDKVFDFAFATPSVTRLVYFSTVASYGAYPGNTIEHRFTEGDPLRSSDYRYAEEKRIAEEHLAQRYRARANKAIAVSVLRPAAITGPRGRYMRIRFGLQAVLSGQLRGSLLYRLISRMTAFVPVTSHWCRQFIHEDDVVAIVTHLAFAHAQPGYEVYNICPPGAIVRGADMARAVGKRPVRVSPQLIRFVFFSMWHLTRGTIPTGRGAWKGYSYPIAVDGSKLTRRLGYTYAHSSLDAFYYTNGAYEEYVPRDMRRTRP